MKKFLLSSLCLVFVAGFATQALSAGEFVEYQYETLEFQYGPNENWLAPSSTPSPCSNGKCPVQPVNPY